MGYFDSLTTSSFKTTEDGRKLFFPWGTVGRGYIVPTEDEYQKLRRTVKIYLMASFPIIILATQFRMLVGIVVIMIDLIPYSLWAYAKSRQMTEAKEKLTLKENTSNMAREQSWIGLWLLELGAIGFVLAGIFIIIKDPKNWMIALASILFFGLAAVVFGKMITDKKRQSTSV